MLKKLFSFPLLLLGAIGFLLSCSPTQELTEPPQTYTPELRTLDTLYVEAPKPTELKTAEEYRLERFNPSATRYFDLLHTKLDLRFDWEKQRALGVAELLLKPHFYPQDTLKLDAKNFDVHAVQMLRPDTAIDLPFRYDGVELQVALGRPYKASEDIQVRIDYTAKPAERDNIGGSAAITSDQGLFFINHDGKDKNKPRQIWTQGETEYNSYWFPTIDKPNERTTQEIYLTVDTVFETLSNGLLITSTDNGDGTRTDYWKLDQPHAPYLFMLGIGDYAVVEERWRDIPVSYYVEHDYREHARDIFDHTPEMLEFFSEKLGVAYPWPKYSQIVVRDYVSGAMENTTASVFGEFVRKTRRELIDNHNDLIVAHELFHQWFGDLVTCESWANLTMNEGFANYSEYLWLEHHDGRDEAENHRLREIRGYLRQAARNPHDLIYYDYENKEATFDAHSYNKGGLVLHMLRHEVGEEAFFAALNKYLTENAYSAVEADELRLAFEDVTGRDLIWFFDQWYFSSGHPELDITYGYDKEKKQVIVTVEQTQNPDRFPPIFILPTTIDLYFEDGRAPQRQRVRVDRRIQTFLFDAPRRPRHIAFDGGEVLLAEKKENYELENYVFQYYNLPAYPDRLQAFREVAAAEFEPEDVPTEVRQLLRDALKDESRVIRSMAVAETDLSDRAILEMVRQLAKTDPHSSVRSAALQRLAASRDPGMAKTIAEVVKRDSAYPVIAEGLQALAELDIETALQLAEDFQEEDNASIIAALSEVYIYSGDPAHLSFFETHLPEVDGWASIGFLRNYAYMLVQDDYSLTEKGIARLKAISIDGDQSGWRRVAAYRALDELRNTLMGKGDSVPSDEEKTRIADIVDELRLLLEEIKEHEVNAEIKGYF